MGEEAAEPPPTVRGGLIPAQQTLLWGGPAGHQTPRCSHGQLVVLGGVDREPPGTAGLYSG